MLERLLQKLIKLSDTILSIGKHFDEIGNKLHLSEEEQETLWTLDDLANRTRTDLLLTEIDYMIHEKPTILSVVNDKTKASVLDLDILDNIEIILQNLIEVSERVRSIIHSKIGWLEMQRNAKSTAILLESSNRLEKSSTWLLIATIILVILTFILAIPALL